MSKSIIYIEFDEKINVGLEELDRQLCSVSKYPTIEEKIFINSLNKDTTDFRCRLLENEDKKSIIVLSANKKIEDNDINILERKIKKSLKSETSYVIARIYVEYYTVTRTHFLGENVEERKIEVYF